MRGRDGSRPSHLSSGLCEKDGFAASRVEVIGSVGEVPLGQVGGGDARDTREARLVGESADLVGRVEADPRCARGLGPSCRSFEGGSGETGCLNLPDVPPSACSTGSPRTAIHSQRRSRMTDAATSETPTGFVAYET